MGKYKSNLQAMRKRAGFKSARAFAEHMGISVDSYTAYEQGKVNMSLLQAWEFADALDCTLDELAGRKSPNVADALTADERAVVDGYRAVDEKAKRDIRRMVEWKLEDMESEAAEKRVI